MAAWIQGSKSSVHRHQQATVRRNQHPESGLWETQEGDAWLQRLVFATLYVFGLQRHVGADTLSEFFKLLHLETHVGVSPTALRTLLTHMEALLPQFQQACEASIPPKSRQAVIAADETFPGNDMILVLMELSSGYLLVEESSPERDYATWLAQSAPRLKALGIDVKHAISDRAKALIKLALDGFQCASGADVFHEQYGLSRWLAPALGRLKGRAETAYQDVQAALTKSPPHAAQTTALETQLEKAVEALEDMEQGQQDYREHLLGISAAVHPFALTDSTCQTSESVVSQLEQRAQALETLANRHGILDKDGAVQKFRNQVKALSSHVGVWWDWVAEILQGLSVDERTRAWLTETLLPVLYWHHQQEKTHNKAHKRLYREAWERAVQAWEADPFWSAGLSNSDQQRWLTWGEWMVRQFHRSSSAVEGRNGCLSQMYHNGRGLTPKRLKALTVIHNYGIRRSDGTTAAERLFEIPFPDLFETLVCQMGALPLPRKARQRTLPNPLIPLLVPA